MYNDETIVQLVETAGLVVEREFIQFPSWVKKLKIDVGLSSNAPQSSEWLKAEPDVAVIGFEPVSENVDALRTGRSTWEKKIDHSLIGTRMFLVPIALGDVEGIAYSTINVTSGDSGRSSLLTPTHFEIKSRQGVRIVALSSFLKLIDFASISFIEHLKTDCQGSDLDILRSAGDMLQKVMVVTAEAEDNQYQNSSNSKGEITTYLRSQGFVSYRRMIWRNIMHRNRFNVDDPTFINYDLYRSLHPKKMQIFQKG